METIFCLKYVMHVLAIRNNIASFYIHDNYGIDFWENISHFYQRQL
jgi:hypothetical protein